LPGEIDLPAQFQIIDERVCLTKYTDPLLASEIDESSAELTAYANTATQSLVVIADYSEITHISTGLISVGLRRGSANPLRNPIIEKIIIIAQLPIIYNLASTVSNILRIEKFVVVQTRAQADREVEVFLQQPKSADN
jgi:hypothetical protein